MTFEPVVMNSGNYSLTSAIDHIEVSPRDPGSYLVDIYLKVTNTGSQPVRLVWYSKLTDRNGQSYGGVGVSHAGSGARTFILYPNLSNTARDYVTVGSDTAMAALREGGATLDVEYANQTSPLEPIAGLRSTWTLPAGSFR
jgi:hypothetical protein